MGKSYREHQVIESYCSVSYFKLKVLIFFFFLATPHGLWGLISPTSDRTWALAVKAPSPNHWTAREFPGSDYLELCNQISSFSFKKSFTAEFLQTVSIKFAIIVSGVW